MRRPVAVWWIEDEYLYVRFENIGDKYGFMEFLGEFKKRLAHPKISRNTDKRGWQLNRADIQDLAVFTYEMLGADSLQPLNASIDVVQLRLV